MSAPIPATWKRPPSMQRLGSGLEGEVFRILSGPYQGQVYKAYRGPAPRPKLEAALALRPRLSAALLPSLAWPQALVELKGRCTGFLMPWLAGMEQSTDIQSLVAPGWGPAFQGLTWRSLLAACANLAALVEELHRQGVTLGDFNPENTRLLLGPQRCRLALVDCDSMDIPDPARPGLIHWGATVKEEYLPPEAFGPGGALRGRPDLGAGRFAADRWQLGLRLFQILTRGSHPFEAHRARRRADAQGGVTLKDHMLKGHSVLLSGERPGLRRPPRAMDVAACLGTDIFGLMELCFVSGYADPARRPAAGAWAGRLRSLRADDRLWRTCPDFGHHEYLAEAEVQGECPWCAWAARIDEDPFEVRGLPAVPRARGVSVSAPVIQSVSAPAISASAPLSAYAPAAVPPQLVGAGGAAGLLQMGLLPQAAQLLQAPPGNAGLALPAPARPSRRTAARVPRGPLFRALSALARQRMTQGPKFLAAFIGALVFIFMMARLLMGMEAAQWRPGGPDYENVPLLLLLPALLGSLMPTPRLGALVQTLCLPFSMAAPFYAVDLAMLWITWNKPAYRFPPQPQPRNWKELRRLLWQEQIGANLGIVVLAWVGVGCVPLLVIFILAA